VNKSHELIKDKKFDFKVYSKIIKFILDELLKTLQELHAVHHCYHNDIRLENVILGNIRFVQNQKGSFDIEADDMLVKLVNFGRAKMYKTNNNPPHDAGATDMWAFGALFYQCMAGEPLPINKSIDSLDIKQDYFLKHIINVLPVLPASPVSAIASTPPAPLMDVETNSSSQHLEVQTLESPNLSTLPLSTKH